MKETIIRKIDFCDIDSTGVMWHGNYCKYYEDARCHLLKKLGFSYHVILENGFQIPIVSLKIKYSKPCYFDQEIMIGAELIESEHFLIIKYEIRDKKSEQIFSEAETKHAFFNIDLQRATINCPKFIQDKLKGKNYEI